MLARMTVLGTLALCVLLWLRLVFLQHQVISFAPIFVLNEPDFQGAVRWILGFNAACGLGAL